MRVESLAAVECLTEEKLVRTILRGISSDPVVTAVTRWRCSRASMWVSARLVAESREGFYSQGRITMLEQGLRTKQGSIKK